MSFFFLFHQASSSGASGDPTLVIEVRVRPTTVPDGGTGTKDPADIAIVQFDWTSQLATGVTISTSTFAVTRIRGTATPALTATADTVLTGGVKAQALLTGGADGSLWKVANTVVLTDGQTKVRSGFVKLEAM